MGWEIKTVLGGNEVVVHLMEFCLSGLYGTIFYEDLGTAENGVRHRNVTIFADGEVDRSPCGSGTSARLALLDSAAELRRGDILVHDSIIGTTFTGRVVGDAEVAGIHSVVTEVRGSAFKTGEALFTLDEHDPVGLGFQLR